MAADTLTPLMRQYVEIKNSYPDALIFFQVGDFYELFFDDARTAAGFLGITLTQRGTHAGEPIPLCGVPLHTSHHYVAKLVRGGYRIVVVDQLTSPQPGKVVERGVTQVLTPGTLTDSHLLDDRSASYLATLYFHADGMVLLFLELLTGQLCAVVLPAGDMRSLEGELARFYPDEIVVRAQKRDEAHHRLVQQWGYRLSFVTQDTINEKAVAAIDWLANLMPGMAQGSVLGNALQILYAYLYHHQPASLAVIKEIKLYAPEDFLILDAATQKHLELLQNAHDGGRLHTLLWVLDKAKTAMGSRLLKKWLQRPLVEKNLIEQRQEAVEFFVRHHEQRAACQQVLTALSDVERIAGRIALRRASLADYCGLARSCAQIPFLQQIFSSLISHAFYQSLSLSFSPECTELGVFLEKAVNDDTSKDWLIKPGYHEELDRLRMLAENGARAVADFERQEQLATGIASLKIRYNGIHGYRIEITKPNLPHVPAHYVRLQSLVNKDCFTTQELKNLEHDLNRAQALVVDLEKQLYEHVKRLVEERIPMIKQYAGALAEVDVFASLATVAYERGYTKPVFHAEQDIIIKEGKHPVVDALLQHAFIPNDTNLTADECLWIITGPNMGGKSTYLRQVALLNIMAQIGSFVPAKSAHLPILDRIFTRIGASDNVAAGKSTFLVEMEETATICLRATRHSLVILDEVGRGTSTYDGLALAQAVVEYIYTTVQARCLFATHYHELASLTQTLPGIAAYHAACQETENGILFLHKIRKGIADSSFGIEIARRAGLPPEIIARARALALTTMPRDGGAASNLLTADIEKILAQHAKLQGRVGSLEAQLKVAQEQQSFVAALDVDNLSPRQAFDLLYRLKEKSIS